MNISVPFPQLFRTATALSLVLLHSMPGMAAAVPQQVETIDPADLAIGMHAPEIVGETIDGEEIRLSDSAEKYRKAVEREKITWPSFWDGGNTSGPIATRWDVHAWPAIYVIDHNGIIRYKHVRGEEMDRVVDRLLSELKSPGMEQVRMQMASIEASAEWDRGLPYANELQIYTRRNPDAPDIIPALLELVKISGKFDDIWMTRGAFWQAMQAAPDSITKRTVQQVYAETILETADPELAREAIVPLLLDAYGYAHETRLVQNLATLLALKGDRQGAEQMYDYILRMHFFSENLLRFRSYEIFVDNPDHVGESFPTGEGILRAGSTGDQDTDRLIFTAGQSAFIHFWTRRSSLEHDVSFLRELQTEFPGLALVSINVGEEADAVDSFVEKYAPDWP